MKAFSLYIQDITTWNVGDILAVIGNTKDSSPAASQIHANNLLTSLIATGIQFVILDSNCVVEGGKYLFYYLIAAKQGQPDPNNVQASITFLTDQTTVQTI